MPVSTVEGVDRSLCDHCLETRPHRNADPREHPEWPPYGHGKVVAPRDVYKWVGALIVHAYGNTCRPLVGRQEPTFTYTRIVLTMGSHHTDRRPNFGNVAILGKSILKIPTFLPPSLPSEACIAKDHARGRGSVLIRMKSWSEGSLFIIT
jgi:hypothetical protein